MAAGTPTLPLTPAVCSEPRTAGWYGTQHRHTCTSVNKEERSPSETQGRAAHSGKLDLRTPFHARKCGSAQAQKQVRQSPAATTADGTVRGSVNPFHVLTSGMEVLNVSCQRAAGSRHGARETTAILTDTSVVCVPLTLLLNSTQCSQSTCSAGAGRRADTQQTQNSDTATNDTAHP